MVRKLTSWNIFVKQVKEENPNLSFSEVLKKASELKKKGKMPLSLSGTKEDVKEVQQETHEIVKKTGNRDKVKRKFTKKVTRKFGKKLRNSRRNSRRKSRRNSRRNFGKSRKN